MSPKKLMASITLNATEHEVSEILRELSYLFAASETPPSWDCIKKRTTKYKPKVSVVKTNNKNRVFVVPDLNLPPQLENDVVEETQFPQRAKALAAEARKRRIQILRIKRIVKGQSYIFPKRKKTLVSIKSLANLVCEGLVMITS